MSNSEQFADPDFGEQPDRNKPKDRVKKLPVMEIFGPTIQGEGLVCGQRTTFIRFGLCDYKCTMCDSMHAVDPKRVSANAKWMTEFEIVEELLKVQQHPEDPYRSNCDWITFSGGNPCIHDLSKLIKVIRGLDITHGTYKISVETQGTKLPDWLHWCDAVCVSPKGPGMGEKFEPEEFSKFVLGFKHHKGFYVKVVVFSAQDLEFAKHINSIMCEEGLGDRMYLSLGNPFPPGQDSFSMENMHDSLNHADTLRLRLLELYDQVQQDLVLIPELRNVKFLPQLHVLVWGNKQGV